MITMALSSKTVTFFRDRIVLEHLTVAPFKMKTFFLKITLFWYTKKWLPYNNDLFLEIALPWNTK